MTEEEYSPPSKPGKSPELFSAYNTNGPLFTMDDYLVPPGTEVRYVGSYTSPIDKEVGERVGDEEFGVWNVYQVKTEKRKKRIETVPNSEGDQKARGLWDPKKA